MTHLFSLISAVETLNPTTEVPLPSYEGAFLKMFLALIALLVAIFATVWVLKRFAQGRWLQGRNNGPHTIHILERRAISPKTVLYVIEVGGKKTVIAESQLEIKPIVSLDSLSETEKT